MAAEPRDPKGRNPPDFAAEDAAFREAMGKLTAVPDKDEGTPRQAEPARARRSEKERRKERQGERLDTLDLHGLSTEQALKELDGFVQRSRAVGRRRVRVITGKGFRSEGGVPVLKQAVLRRLRKRGERRVERVETAPAHLGGSGAFILTLRRRGER